MTNLIDARPTGPAAAAAAARPDRPGAPPPPHAGRPCACCGRCSPAVLILGALVWGPYSGRHAARPRGARRGRESFPAAGLTPLEVDGAAGSIDDHRRRDATRSRCAAEISDGLRATGESREVVGDVLRLRSTCPNFGSDLCWVDYDVTVPPGSRAVVDRRRPVGVEVSAVTGGSHRQRATDRRC